MVSGGKVREASVALSSRQEKEGGVKARADDRRQDQASITAQPLVTVI